jgi:branched-chain amino acid aminotransferase
MEKAPERSVHLAIFYVDGSFVQSDKAVIPVDDLAVLRGIGVWDLMRTFQGRPYFLKEHLERLEQSARSMNLVFKWQIDELEAIVLETLDRNRDVDEANIRIIITGGSSTDFMTHQGNPRLLVLITQIPPLPREWYSKGVKVITVNQEREVPEAKSLAYIPAALAQNKAKSLGGVEALYVSRDGLVTEGTTSNLFAVLDGVLITPADRVLKGITRKAILSLAEKFMDVELRSIPLTALLSAEEVFITGTNKGVVPVVRVNDTTIGDGTIGDKTRQIIKALDQYTLQFKKGKTA